MRKIELHWQIMIAIVLAAISGWAINQAIAAGIPDPSFLGISIISFFDYIGTLFLNALKMIIVPLIFSSITVGVAGIGSGDNLGKLGGRTLVFYITTTTAAILIGLVLINVIGPGYVNGEPAGAMLALDGAGSEIADLAQGRGPFFMYPDQGDLFHRFSGPGGTTSTWPFKISDFPSPSLCHCPTILTRESGENPSSQNAG